MLSDDEQSVVLGEVSKMTKREIGVICGWSPGKSWSLTRLVEKKTGVHRDDFDHLIGGEPPLIKPPIEGYRVRWWWTTRCGRISINQIQSMDDTTPYWRRDFINIKDLPVYRKATKHTIKQAAWWAGFSVGDILGRAKAVKEDVLLEAGRCFGYTVSRIVDNKGEQIEGPPVYGIEASPTIADRIALAVGEGPALVGVEVLAEAFGLDMSTGPKMIESAAQGDDRFALEFYRKKLAVRSV